jgi:Protein of unknown function (DUF3027)
MTVSPTATRHAEPDQACVEAVDLARQAAADDVGASLVGEHLGIETEGDRLVTHLFDCLDPAYVGWRWAVTVSRASRSKVVTVSESLLLPGPESLLAPAWVPWTERVRPGDLKAGDLMPASADDERLVPFVALAGDAGLHDWDENGASQPRRTLSAIGRDEAAARWHAGDQGPKSALAHTAPANCVTCGFLVRLDGPLGRVFGVCANEFAPDDGSVVSVDHGCGAHSDGDVTAEPESGADAAPTIDELGFDMVNAASALPDSIEAIDVIEDEEAVVVIEDEDVTENEEVTDDEL